MPRTGLAKWCALGQLVNAASHNAAASEVAASQLLNAAKSRGLSTVATVRAVATGVKPALQPCTCGKVLCPGHARGFSTGLGAALAEAAAQHEL